MIFLNVKFMKTKVLIHTSMIVIRAGSLRGQRIDLLHARQKYTYETERILLPLIPMRTLIIRKVFVRARQSYARESRKRLTHTISLCM